MFTPIYHTDPRRNDPRRVLFAVLETEDHYLAVCDEVACVYAVSKADYQLTETTDEGDDLV